MRNTGTLNVTTPTDREIVLTRTFGAPRRLVFDAFTKPLLLKRWFGPRGWSLVVCEVDLRVGSGFRFVLRGPDGRDMGMSGVYREIVPNRKLVYTWAWKTTPERESVVTIELRAAGSGTELTLRHEQFADEEARNRHEHGWKGCLARLERAVA